MEEKEVYLDLTRFIRAVVKKWWLIFLAAVVFAGGTFFYTVMCITPLYTSKTTLYVDNTEDYVETISPGALSAAQSLASSYTTILTSNRVLSNVSDAIDNVYSAGQLQGMVSASRVGETEILQIVVNCVSSKDAQKIANLVAEEGAVAITTIVNAGKVSVVDEANLPSTPSSPNTKKNTIIGFLFGAIIVVAGVIIKELLDTRIKSEEDLIEEFDANIIGVISRMEDRYYDYKSEK